MGLKRRLEVRSTLELSDIGRPGEGEERERNERQKETAKSRFRIRNATCRYDL